MCGSISVSNALCLASTFSTFGSALDGEYDWPGGFGILPPPRLVSGWIDLQHTPIMMPQSKREIRINSAFISAFDTDVVRIPESEVLFPEMGHDIEENV